MNVEVAELPIAQLAAYAAIPIAFRVTHRVVPTSLDRDAPAFRVEPIAGPYRKDYDALVGMSPLAWPLHHDLREWSLLVARRNGVCIGGVAITSTPALVPADSPPSSAVLWDLRVAPEARRHAVGTALFRAAEQWAMSHGYRWLVIETQDVNVAACRFYEKMECRLVAHDAQAYPDLPGEGRLIWHRRLPVDRLAV